MRSMRTQTTVCLDQERQIIQLAAEYGVQDFSIKQIDPLVNYTFPNKI